jgi:hypothetical protein
MRQLISIDQLYSRPFNCALKDIPYVEYAKEFLSGVPYDQSKYMKYLLNLLNNSKTGLVWGRICDFATCMERAGYYQSLCLNMQRALPLEIKQQRVFGCVRTIDNFSIVVDGHHRAGAMIALGVRQIYCEEP